MAKIDDQNIPSGILGQLLLNSIFKLRQLIKLYQANNHLVVDNLNGFRLALSKLCHDDENVDLRIYRGRFYLNEDRLVCDQATFAVAAKMIEYFQDRTIEGLRFYGQMEISDEAIVGFIGILNQADTEQDPLIWMQDGLENSDYGWVELLKQGLRSQANDPNLDDVARSAYRKAMAAMARKTYSHALTSMTGITNQLATGQPGSIKKTKRVIQDLIEVLTKDESVLLGMSTIRDYDDYTYTHSVNVAILSMCLGKRIGLDRSAIERLGLCALFHDLGKVDVPIELIKKRERLTYEEYEEVKKHAIYSIKEIVSLNIDYAFKAQLLLPPFEHHLRVDLLGYPQSNRREPLSLLGRILAVTDHYDAITSNRSYRNELISPHKALKLMIDEAGTQLDPIILKIFIDMVGVYPTGSILILDTGEVGLVVESSEKGEPGRPVVRLLVNGGAGHINKDRMADLSEKDESGDQYKRNVMRCLHPSGYGIQPVKLMD